MTRISKHSHSNFKNQFHISLPIKPLLSTEPLLTQVASNSSTNKWVIFTILMKNLQSNMEDNPLDNTI